MGKSMRLKAGFICLLCGAFGAAATGGDLTDQEIAAGFAAASTPVAARAALFDADPLTRDLLSWVILRGGHDQGAELADYLHLAARHPDWPQDARMQAAAEAQVSAKTSDAAVLAYFMDRDPVTANGFAALLRALKKAGAAAKSQQVSAKIWPNLSLSEEEQSQLIAEFAPLLAPYHSTRADELLWAGRRAEAQMMAPLLSSAQRMDLATRLAYLGGKAEATGSSATGNTPGAAYAKFSGLAARGQYSEAVRLIASRESAAQLGRPAAWAKWRARLARWLLRSSRGQEAHDLATGAHTDYQDGYLNADLDWIAGYAALTALDAPASARDNFKEFADQVKTPISLGRAYYWLGEAQDALGDSTNAQEAWRRAALYQTSFYGQLAAEKAEVPFDPDLLNQDRVPTSLSTSNELVEALDILARTSQRGLAYSFAEQIAKTAQEGNLRAATLRMLARGKYFLALRLAKGAAARGILIPEAIFPLHPLAGLEGISDPALALAIARQESEFRQDAGSSAGALGLMQLMPKTAEQMAGKLSEEYRLARLTSDWAYNAKLGSGYLDLLRAEFGNSPVLLAVAYNAGPGRARDWIGRYGDPRRQETDPVTWIENIPFDETRNYVMRVTEAIRPYEARLTGALPKRSLSEILRGEFPKLRPKSRGDQLRGRVEPVPAISRPRARGPAKDAGGG